MTENIESIPVEIPKKARDLFERGEQSLNSSNYDYAIALLEGALSLAPSFTDCRKKLRLAQFRKFDLEKPGVISLYLRLLFNFKNFLHASYHAQKGEWMDAMEEYEKILKIHPRHRSTLISLSKAAEHLKMTDIAIDSLNAIRAINPRDILVLKEMARIYKGLDQLSDARNCYEEILNISPDDPDAQPELRRIAAIKTIRKTGWEKMDTYRDKIRDEDQAKTFENEVKIAKSDSEIKDYITSLEKKLELAPDNQTIMKNLAELYLQIHDFSKAEEMTQRCLALSPADPGLKRNLAQIEIKRMDRDINIFKEQLFDNPSDERLKQTVRELEHRKKSLRLEDCVARVEQYPTNLMLRFELGTIFMENGMYDKAVSEFQLSVKTPSKRIQSLNSLGVCFKAKKMYDLAVEQFTAASEAIRDISPMKKEIIYNLASTYEDMGNIEKAIIEYKKIYSVDVAYKDVTEKIEKMYKGKLNKEKP